MSFLTRMFPKKADTLQEFIALAEARKAAISITPMMDNNFNSVLVCEAQTGKGRRIVYRDVITRRDGGIGTALAFAIVPGAVQKESIRLCLAGEKKVKELRQKLPGIRISLTFEGKVMESFDELHLKAVAQGVYV